MEEQPTTNSLDSLQDPSDRRSYGRRLRGPNSNLYNPSPRILTASIEVTQRTDDQQAWEPQQRAFLPEPKTLTNSIEVNENEEKSRKKDENNINVHHVVTDIIKLGMNNQTENQELAK
jgi:hypothetical protein